MDNFRILIGDVPYRERLIAEIYFNNMYWVELSYEEEEVIIQFYPHPTEACWEFSFDEAMKVLEQAKKKLLGM